MPSAITARPTIANGNTESTTVKMDGTMKKLIYLALLGFLTSCHKADQPGEAEAYLFPEHRGAEEVRGGRELGVILKRIGGNCPRELLDMRMPVSFPVEPNVWEATVDHNRMIVIISVYTLQTNIEVVSYETMKSYDRAKHQ